MLLWINGPFGGGKTQTAHEIRRRLPGSVVCDPEQPGYGLHRMLPPGLRGDFQDLKAWRQGVVEVLDLTLTRREGVVIAPMTVTDPGHFSETVGRLRELGHDVRHFTLLAERETVLRRLKERGLGQLIGGGLRRESWAVERLDHCLERLAGPEFAEHLWTDHSTVPKTADRIAVLAGLTLRPHHEGRLRTRLRQAGVGLRHIRLG
ncbi:ATP-binding protein [Actinospica acidiphila]|uniref:AAA family ATPase n=1 Tax=Streptomyces TaxID=1883 RepID=UPI000EF59DCC|nr:MULTISPECIES: AAA family ATPase [unclassified Streptomyces]MBQ0975778.1 ATP-binding protein [Streptomyces sp. RK31]MBU5944851.1 ATP-binding protein [Streptomyces sp. PAM3C]MUT91831.1 ATP-binding protein [Streptomyces sp. Z38]NEA82435.1 ATP-binding protein [Actinospica acidiphila]